MTSICEAFDVYDYMREKCKKLGPWTEDIGIKEWLERALVINGLYVFKPKKRILGVMFGWPTDEVEEDSEPQYRANGEIFYAKFHYLATNNDIALRSLAAMALERHPFVSKFCFVDYAENGESSSRLLELAEETVDG